MIYSIAYLIFAIYIYIYIYMQSAWGSTSLRFHKPLGSTRPGFTGLRFHEVGVSQAMGSRSLEFQKPWKPWVPQALVSTSLRVHKP